MRLNGFCLQLHSVNSQPVSPIAAHAHVFLFLERALGLELFERIRDPVVMTKTLCETNLCNSVFFSHCERT